MVKSFAKNRPSKKKFSESESDESDVNQLSQSRKQIHRAHEQIPLFEKSLVNENKSDDTSDDDDEIVDNKEDSTIDREEEEEEEDDDDDDEGGEEEENDNNLEDFSENSSSDDDDDEAEETTNSNLNAKIKEQLIQMSFEDVHKLQNKIGLKK
jgi:hypothetical protein